MKMLNVPASSLASQLPQGIVVGLKGWSKSNQASVAHAQHGL
jgi:hypothetical protein